MGEPDGWFSFLLFGKRFRLFPLGPLEPLFVLHDLHHLYTGYETTIGGEAEGVAWEIASGGYAKYGFAWLDILKVLALALLYQERFRAAWTRGRQESNLYGRDLEAVLETEGSGWVQMFEARSVPKDKKKPPFLWWERGVPTFTG